MNKRLVENLTLPDLGPNVFYNVRGDIAMHLVHMREDMLLRHMRHMRRRYDNGAGYEFLDAGVV